MRRKQSRRSKRSSQRLFGLIVLASTSRTCTFIYALFCVPVRIHLLIHHLVCLCFSSVTGTLGKHYGLIIPDFANGMINEELKKVLRDCRWSSSVKTFPSETEHTGYDGGRLRSPAARSRLAGIND